MSIKVAFILMAALSGYALADISPYGPPVHHHAPVVHHAPTPYDYGYGVSDAYTGNDFGHSESSDGNVVKGSYHVLLPDGRKQVVTYTADHYNGFQAQVAYEGTAHYPEVVGHAHGHGHGVAHGPPIYG
ncbi:larval cuticle protein A2B-like [Macrobrachium nipponense]|uniref:larval cuticle protein A2B-like n=1 Tax=Macrobrachium nipponense TaxID=159736 RepID=UPI0030C897B2